MNCKTRVNGKKVQVKVAPAAHAAYLKGWTAYNRGTDLETAEDNFIRRHGRANHDEFIGAYLDRNRERPKFHDFVCPLRKGGSRDACTEAH